jgi:antitoxin VapB
MTTEYHVKLIQQGDIQTLSIPQELALSTSEAIVRKEAEKLIIEPYQKKSLLEVLASLEDSEEDIDLSDRDLLPSFDF